MRADGVGDFEAQLGRAGAEAFEPEGALVEAVERVLPREAVPPCTWIERSHAATAASVANAFAAAAASGARSSSSATHHAAQ